MERASTKRKRDTDDASGGKPKLSFSERMMLKMGHKKGEGLGKHGDGIVEPVSVQMRPTKVGLGAVKERSEQAKREMKRQAERRGEVYVDSSEEEREAEKRRKKLRKAVGGVSSGASTPGGGRSKPKISLAVLESEGLHVPSSLKEIVDATGRETRLLTSTAGLSLGGAVAAETTEEKLAKRVRRDVEAYAEAFNQLVEDKKTIDFQEAQLERQLILLEEEVQMAQEFANAAAPLRGSTDLKDAISLLSTLQSEFPAQPLADIAVAAIHPHFKREMLVWQPLDDPVGCAPDLLHIAKLFSTDKEEDGLDTFDKPRKHKKSTTEFESLIYMLWLPKVRKAITNEWSPYEPSALVALVEAWSPILPRFVYNHLINQLVVPKLRTAVEEWSPRKEFKRKNPKPLLHLWILPWMPYLPPEHTDPQQSGLISTVRRTVRTMLDTWDIGKGVLPGLESWRSLLGEHLDKALISHLLPRLATILEQDFEVDPSDQDLEPLSKVLLWKPFFRLKVFGELIVLQLFPKILATLHLWLTSDSPSYTEIGSWFQWWKTVLPEDLNDFEPISAKWNEALGLIDSALDLGENAKTDLPLPDTEPRRVEPETPKPSTTAGKEPRSARKEMEETTFKDVVEAFCGEENLLLIPLREAHDKTGLPLFRITASATGRGGVVVYFKGDVVYAQSKKDKSLWEPAGLEESLVSRAEGK